MSDNTSQRRALVTGGAGFLGSHLAEELLDAGYDVTVVDPATWPAELASRVDVTRVGLDVGNPAFWEQLASASFDVIFHLAGSGDVYSSVVDPRADLGRNFLTGFDLLEWARATQSPAALIFASTASVYGTPQRVPIREDDPTQPISPYGVSKLALERYAAVFSRVYGLRTASLRYFSLYGPRQRKLVIYDMLQKLLQQPVATIIGDGSQVRDFCFVKDAVRATRLVAESNRLCGDVFNVASGVGTSIRELAERLQTISGSRTPLEYTGSVRPGDGQAWVADIARIREVGFAPEWTLEAGLESTVAWFRQQHARNEAVS